MEKRTSWFVLFDLFHWSDSKVNWQVFSYNKLRQDILLVITLFLKNVKNMSTLRRSRAFAFFYSELKILQKGSKNRF